MSEWEPGEDAASFGHGAVGRDNIASAIEEIPCGQGATLVGAVTAQGIQGGGAAEDLNRGIVYINKHDQGSGLMVMIICSEVAVNFLPSLPVISPWALKV